MSRVFFREELEPTATFWRVLRRDGVTLGFTSHDRDLWFEGVLHRAAPGMLPSAIRRTADLGADSVEVEGALTHDAISSADLAAGLFDGAQVQLGIADWQTGELAVLYRGEIGRAFDHLRRAGEHGIECRIVVVTLADQELLEHVVVAVQLRLDGERVAPPVVPRCPRSPGRPCDGGTTTSPGPRTTPPGGLC